MCQAWVSSLDTPSVCGVGDDDDDDETRIKPDAATMFKQHVESLCRTRHLQSLCTDDWSNLLIHSLSLVSWQESSQDWSKSVNCHSFQNSWFREAKSKIGSLYSLTARGFLLSLGRNRLRFGFQK